MIYGGETWMKVSYSFKMKSDQLAASFDDIILKGKEHILY